MVTVLHFDCSDAFKWLHHTWGKWAALYCLAKSVSLVINAWMWTEMSTKGRALFCSSQALWVIYSCICSRKSESKRCLSAYAVFSPKHSHDQTTDPQSLHLWINKQSRVCVFPLLSIFPALWRRNVRKITLAGAHKPHAGIESQLRPGAERLGAQQEFLHLFSLSFSLSLLPVALQALGWKCQNR